MHPSSKLRPRPVKLLVLASWALLTLSLPPAARGFETGPALPGAWHSLGPDGGQIDALAVHPTDPRIVYAGGSGGVYRSSDGGATWVPSSRGLVRTPIFVNGATVGSLQIDRGHPNILYAGLEHEGLARSTDGGASWTYVELDAALQFPGVSSLALDPIGGKRLFAATYNGLYRSGDGGSTWRLLTRGVPSGPGTEALFVTVDPVSPQNVYAIFPQRGGQGRTVYKSTNAGATWRSISTGPLFGRKVVSFAVHPLAPQTFYAGCVDGFVVSTDGGATWREKGLSFLRFQTILVHPGRRGMVYAGTDRGVYRTGDNGGSWTPLYRFPNDIKVQSLAFSPSNEATLYAGTSLGALGLRTGGVFKSLDAGASWSFSGAGIRALSVRYLSVDPKDPSKLWLGTDRGLWKSADRGASWARVGFEKPCGTTFSIAIDLDPEHPDTAYLATLANSGSGLCATRDGGATWTPILTSASSIDVVRVDPQRPATLYGAGDGIWKSLDRGTTWARIGGTPQRRLIADLLLATRGPAAAYAPAWPRSSTFPFQLLRSTDSGAAWERLATSSGSGAYEQISLDPFDSRTLYAAAGEDGRLRRSADGGLHWSVVAEGLPARYFHVLASKAIAGRLYLALGDGLVNASDDGGASWRTLGGRLDAIALSGLLADDPSSPDRFYAGTIDGPLLAFTRAE